MSGFEAFIIGLLQGLTEFFPISSSAHLKLAKMLFGIQQSEQQVIFDLVCHFGTLIAAISFLWRDINRQTIKLMAIALIPLIPAYFLLKPLRVAASQTSFLGFSLMLTALILFLGQKIRFAPGKKGYDALWIGTMQSAALIPGISRSASTISAASALGWEAKDAVRFSFLLSIPTIMGGNCLELLKMAVSKQPLPDISVSVCLIGFFSSCLVGMIIIRYAIQLLEKGNLRPFAWYCFSLGLLTTIYFNI